MSGREDTLFMEGDLRPTVEGHFAKAVEKVDALPEQQFLAADDDTLVDHVVPDLQVQPIELHEDAAQMTQEETKVDASHWARWGPYAEGGPHYVPGQRVTVSIPFGGDPMLWKLKPSTWRPSFPHGQVRRSAGDLGGILDIVMERPSDAPEEQFKAHLNETLKDIRFYLGHQKEDIERANKELPGRVRQAVQARRARLEKHGKVRQLLNIPLARRPGAPDLEQIPIKRKLMRPLPPVPNAAPEPGIRDEDYEHILGVIRHEGRTFETTPGTYAVHGEEELRDIILAHLNGHYQGDATGEAFRRSGKTDIRIEAENRAAFVAECKVWRGPKELLGAVDQLRDYLTWRDCKAALVIFNKDVAGFSGIQEKVPAELKQHEAYLGELNAPEAGEWRIKFRASDDAQRIITVHVFLFNLYVAKRAQR